MATTNLLNTVTSDYGSLIGNGRMYRVPRFQRDYSWTEEQWEDLWSDILGVEDEKVHYMGYAVFQTENDKDFWIIDGQQRFTTLSILALAIMGAIQSKADRGEDPTGNRERVEELRRQFIGYKDPAALTTSSRLTLNRNNDDFYQSYLLRMRPPVSKARLKPSERLMWDAFEYFRDAIQRTLSSATGADLAKFLNETVARKLVFTTIYVSDDLRAYKVFETLNARGVKLSSTDLLKNYLFAVVDRARPADLPEAERQWQGINNTLGNEDFTTFLRHYWNAGHTLERKQTLFKAIRRELGTADEVFALLADLEFYAPLYIGLTRPEDPMWTKEQRASVAELDLFNVSQCYPLLFAARRALDESQFARLLRVCAVISLRYNVISSLTPNEMERVYSRVAIRVWKRDLTTCAAILPELKPLYVADDKFKSTFSYRTINTNGNRWKRLVRYILFAIENHWAGKQYDFDDTNATVEHILPENPGQAWEVDFPADTQETETYRLGNYTLLEAGKNRDCQNLPFAGKIAFYKTSGYVMTQRLAASPTWTPGVLHKRQEAMAQAAATIWRIDY
jgi:hypothetical protein